MFKKNMGLDGSVEKHKVLMAMKGYSQVEGIDYDEIFSLVAKLTSIQILLSLAIVHDWGSKYMTMKITFLHGDLEEEI